MTQYLIHDKGVCKMVFAEHRLQTFKKWPYSSDVPCNTSSLAAAGFVYSGTKEDPSSAVCVFCNKDLCFDPEDNPWQEHARRMPDCPLVRLNKKEEDMTVRDICNLNMELMVAAKRAELQNVIETMNAGYGELTDMYKKAIS